MSATCERYAPFLKIMPMVASGPPRPNGSEILKAILRNNVIALLIMLCLSLITWGILKVCWMFNISEKQGTPLSWIWAVFVLSIYFISGYLLSGKVFIIKSRFKNIISFSCLFLFGILLWIYCMLNQDFFGLNWGFFFLAFPFAFPIWNLLNNIGFQMEYVVVFSIIPTFIFWTGLEVKRNQKGLKDETNAILGN